MSVAAGETLARAVGFARRNPDLVAALGVLLLALVGGGYVVHRLRRPAGVRFASLLADRETVTVLTHPDPDPDAMAAALGVASLAEQLDTEATITFPGQIRHQENRAFRNVLELDLDPIESAADMESGTVVLVDHNQARGFDGASDIRPIAVVDHHPGDGRGDLFTDVRTEYGACSSIVAEYFRDLDARPVPADAHESEVSTTHRVPSRVATALFVGILTDTGQLTTGATAADFDASAFLASGIDDELLDRIINPPVSADVLETKARATREREVRGAFALSDVGEVEAVDSIAQAVDELVRLEGVTAAIVYGVRDGTVHRCGRSRDDRVNMGRVLDWALSDIPGGNGGGHVHMGGGQIRIEGNDEVDWPDCRDRLTDRLWRALDGDV